MADQWTTLDQLNLVLGDAAPQWTDAEKTEAIQFATVIVQANITCEVAVGEDLVTSGYWTYTPGSPPPPGNGQIREDGTNLYVTEVDDDAVDRAGSFDTLTEPLVRISHGGEQYLFTLDQASSDEGTYRRLVGSFDVVPTIPTGERVLLEWLNPGLPTDPRFQLATAVVAARVLTATHPVGATSDTGVVSETIGGYSYRLAEGGGGTGIDAVMVLGNDSTMAALIGWCLPQANYVLDIFGDRYVGYASCGCGCRACHLSAHCYGVPCETPYRATHYPYPDRAR